MAAPAPGGDDRRSFDAEVRSGNAYQAGQQQTINNSHTVHNYAKAPATRRSGTVIAVAACASMVAVAAYALLDGIGRDKENRGDGLPGGVGTTSAVAPAPPVASVSSPAATAPETAPVPVVGASGASERITLQGAGPGAVQVVDLDRPSGRSERMPDKDWHTLSDQEQGKADLFLYNSSWAKFEVNAGSGRTAGVVPAGRPVTAESCLAAARTGALQRFTLAYGYRSDLKAAGLEPGASICVVTDQQLLVRATITDLTWKGNDAVDTGVLTVETTPLSRVQR